MNSTTWAETATFLQALVVCCCRTENGMQVPPPALVTPEIDAAVGLWIRKKLNPLLTHPIPQEIRWGLLQRARAALAYAGSAALHQLPPPPASLPRMLDTLLLEMAGKLPVPDLSPDIPPWLE